MNPWRAILVVTLAILSISGLAYLVGTQLGEKPFSWDNQTLLENHLIQEGIQGKWRNTLLKLGSQLQELPNKGKGSNIVISKNSLQILPESAGGVLLQNTFALETNRNPAWFDLTNPLTKECWLGIIEINQAKTRIRFLMRQTKSTFGRPKGFKEVTPEDIYLEYSR